MKYPRLPETDAISCLINERNEWIERAEAAEASVKALREIRDELQDESAKLVARIAELEAVAEEAEMLVIADNKADNYVDFTDLEQYLYAAGYLKEQGK